MYAVQVQDVHKTYKNGIQALNGLNLTVKPGEIFSLLGQNGAGKSTLIRILTTYLKADSGSIKVSGADITDDPERIRPYIACVSQRISIDPHLSLEQNMMFQGDLYKVPKDKAKQRMLSLIEGFDLKPFLKYPVASYSGGMKRRLDIALNMMSNPKILFLDEPTVGMDIQSRMAMWNMLKKIRDDFGTTVFLTTHYLEEADRLSDTVCIMKDGQAAVQGSPSELKRLLRQNSIKITCFTKEHAVSAEELLSNKFDEYRTAVDGSLVTVVSDDSTCTFRNVARFFLDKQIPFKGIEISQPDLEDVFLRLTEKEEM